MIGIKAVDKQGKQREARTFGELIKAIRTEQGVTVREFAKGMGVTYQGINLIENGTDPYISTALKIMAALEITIEPSEVGDAKE